MKTPTPASDLSVNNNLSDELINDKLTNDEIQISGIDVAPDFSIFKLNKQLLDAITEMGYTEPTPIQQKGIPAITAGHDILGIAQTGTGKTAAFLLPLLMKVKYAQGSNPRALILVPTRELAMQIDSEIEKIGKYTDIRHTCVYGGLGPKTQIESLRKGIDILTGTPGRVMELYLRGDLILKEVKTFILDEADRMMDMGFMPQIRKMLEVLPRKRQNLLFSATMPEKVVTLSAEFLEYPVKIEVAPQSMAAETIEQFFYAVPNVKTKINLLQHFFEDKTKFSRVIIFVRNKRSADNISNFLDRKYKDTTKVIHSNKGQNARINAIDAFREGNVRFLVATDVAARGIDITDVSHVINFDVPLHYEDYVHRIGRTGRAKKDGVAITFFNEADEYHVQKIERMMRKKISILPIPEGVTIEATPYEEKQVIALELDRQRKKEDPNFKGAFHEKTKKIPRRKPAITQKSKNEAIKDRKTNATQSKNGLRAGKGDKKFTTKFSKSFKKKK
jgi:ATP-dependent RNA helicase RhlE